MSYELNSYTWMNSLNLASVRERKKELKADFFIYQISIILSLLLKKLFQIYDALKMSECPLSIWELLLLSWPSHTSLLNTYILYKHNKEELSHHYHFDHCYLQGFFKSWKILFFVTFVSLFNENTDWLVLFHL